MHNRPYVNLVSNAGIKHRSGRKRNAENDILYPYLGSVLKNAIRVNELNPDGTDKYVTDVFVYLGAMHYGNEVLPVRIQVNHKGNSQRLDSVDVLKSLNTKIGNSASQGISTSLAAKPLASLPDISIADLIAIAQPLHKEIFSRDVANALGVAYKGSSIGARYSLAVTDSERDAYEQAMLDGDDDQALNILRDVAANAMPNTKVVDADGKPKVVYHHTENLFTKFDLGKARRSMDIQGFFFYDDPNAGEEYGRRNYPCFLNITNPYVIDSQEKFDALKWDMSKDDEGVRIREELMAQGYDGVVTTTGYSVLEADEWIAFKQTKGCITGLTLTGLQAK